MGVGGWKVGWGWTKTASEGVAESKRHTDCRGVRWVWCQCLLVLVSVCLFVGPGVSVCWLGLVSVFVGPGVSVCWSWCQYLFVGPGVKFLLLVLVSVFVCRSWCLCLLVGPGVSVCWSWCQCLLVGPGVSVSWSWCQCFLVLVSISVCLSWCQCLLVLVSVFVCWSWYTCSQGYGDLQAAGCEDCGLGLVDSGRTRVKGLKK